MARETAETDRVRLAVSTVEALVHAASQAFDNLLCPDADDATRRQIERIAALLGAATTAAALALEEIDRTAERPTTD